MKNIVLLFCLLLAAHLLGAHSTLSGVIVDTDSGQPLPGALAALEGSSRYSVADNLGHFSFENLSEDTVTLLLTYIGYKPLRARVAVGQAMQRYELEIQALDLPAVEIRPALSGNASLLNQVDIHNRPIRNAQEVLRFVPGLFIAQHAGGGKAEQIFLRGFDIDHGTDLALSVDGLPVNMVSHAHGQGYADLHFLIPELIEQVSYQKGPYDPAIGNFSTAGAVRFQTLNALDRNFLKLEAGQFDSYRALAGIRLLGQAENSPQQAYVASSYQFTDGYFDAPQNFYRFNVLAKYQNKVSETQLWRLTASAFTSEWDASGQIPERAIASGLISRFGAIDNTEGGQASRNDINLEHFKVVGREALLKTQAYYTRYNFELYSNFTFFDRDPVNGDQIRQKESRQIVGLNTTLQSEEEWLGLPGESEVGLSLRMDAIDGDELSYTANRSTTLQQVSLGDVRELNFGAFARRNFHLTEVLHLSAGLRMDAFRFQYEDKTQAAYEPLSVTKALVSPKLSLFYRISPNLQANLQSGFSFHSNDTRVVLAQEGRDILPRAFGNELNLILKPFPRLLAQIGFWRLHLDQEFVYVGDEGIVEPSGETRRLGIDLSTRLQLARWLHADFDINYAMPRALDAPEGEAYIPLAPILTSTGGLEVNLSKGWSGSARYRYLAARPANEDNSLRADGYFLVDAALNYAFPKLELGIGVQNLLNSEWKEAQFGTTSRLAEEPDSVTEIHFTPGTPFFLNGQVRFFF
ncbi:MAG: TonB-dependent receptor [Phaeodactylibacter sp.]|nr:TonB-dependent receptor [Phaeodactylibacter sp.]